MSCCRHWYSGQHTRPVWLWFSIVWQSRRGKWHFAVFGGLFPTLVYVILLRSVAQHKHLFCCNSDTVFTHPLRQISMICRHYFVFAPSAAKPLPYRLSFSDKLFCQDVIFFWIPPSNLGVLLEFTKPYFFFLSVFDKINSLGNWYCGCNYVWEYYFSVLNYLKWIMQDRL